MRSTDCSCREDSNAAMSVPASCELTPRHFLVHCANRLRGATALITPSARFLRACVMTHGNCGAAPRANPGTPFARAGRQFSLYGLPAS